MPPSLRAQHQAGLSVPNGTLRAGASESDASDAAPGEDGKRAFRRPARGAGDQIHNPFQAGYEGRRRAEPKSPIEGRAFAPHQGGCVRREHFN